VTHACSRAYRPAFPSLPVRLRSADERTEVITALVDTGADITFVPTALLEQIAARDSTPAQIRSHFGDVHTVQLYLIGLEIETLSLPGQYVVGDDTGAEVILGRDVLNKLAVFLDGPHERSTLVDDDAIRRFRLRVG